MAQPEDPSPIERWMHRELKPTQAGAARRRSELRRLKGTLQLPSVDVPLSHEYPGHWRDNGMVWDIVWSLSGARRVLDVGTADGWPALRLAKYFPHVVGIDASPGSVEAAQGNARRLGIENARFCAMDPTAMGFADASFDGAVAAGTLEGAGGAAATVCEMFRALKPGGTVRVYYETFGPAVGEEEMVSVCPAADGSVRYVYVRRSARGPGGGGPFERAYCVDIDPARLADRRALGKACARTGPGRFVELEAAPELGIGLLEEVSPGFLSASWFESEYMSARRLIEILEDAGFENVRTTYAGAELSYRIYRSLSLSRLPDELKRDFEPICRAAGRLATELDAPLPSNGPVSARKPLEEKVGTEGGRR